MSPCFLVRTPSITSWLFSPAPPEDAGVPLYQREQRRWVSWIVKPRKASSTCFVSFFLKSFLACSRPKRDRVTPSAIRTRFSGSFFSYLKLHFVFFTLCSDAVYHDEVSRSTWMYTNGRIKHLACSMNDRVHVTFRVQQTVPFNRCVCIYIPW